MKAFMGMLLVGAALGLVVWGCEDEGGSPPPPPDVGSIQIVLGDDTLSLQDSTTAIVIVLDRAGLVLPGVKIDAWLSDSTLGFLEYVNSAMRDTTNELGRVELLYHANVHAGRDTVIASADGVVTRMPILITTGVANSCLIQRGPDSLHVWPGHPDSTWIRLTLRDPNGNGIPNVQIALSVSAGRFTPFTETDSSGRAEAWWIFDPGEYGHFCMRFTPCEPPDSVCVNVGP